MGRIPRVLTSATLLATPLLLSAGPARAQLAADSLRRNDNGTWTVWVGGVRHVALGEAALRRLAAREDSLRTALARVAELETIIRAREAQIPEMDRQIAAGEALIAAQKAQISTQERLIGELERSIAGGFSLDIGGGASRHDGVAGIAAARFRRWGLWGLAGSERGPMAGLTYRLIEF